MKELTRLRLRGIIVCSFTRSEVTNLTLYQAEKSYPGDLRAGEAFLFLAKGLDQLAFVFRPVQVTGQGEVTRTVFDSRRLRLDGGTWHPYMIQNYASAVGIELEGLRKLEDILEDQRRTKRASAHTRE